MIIGLPRRSVLATGAASLTVGCFLPVPRRAHGRAPSSDGATALNAWVVVGPGDRIGVRVASTEMGQGIHTLLAMLVAEELAVDPHRVEVSLGPIVPAHENPLFGAQITGDSSSAVNAFEPLRRAGAQARSVLIAAAAVRWGCPVTDCRAVDGAVRRLGTGMSLSYGALAADAALLAPPRDVPLTPPAAWRVLGRRMTRLDAAERLRGTTRYAIDVRRPGLLYAAVRNCPVAGGRLKDAGDESAGVLPGVLRILPLDDAVLVVATSTWAAFQAADALRPRWEIEPVGAPSTEASVSSARDPKLAGTRLNAALARPGLVAMERGTERKAARTLSLHFEVPPLAHAALEPPSATVEIADGRVDVWASTQAQTMARDAVADVCGLPPDRVRLHGVPLGGSFGRKLYSDFVRQAALAARAVGRPVKLTWSRAEDLACGFYRPPAATMIEIGLDAAGMPVSWRQRLAVPALHSPLKGAPMDSGAVRQATIDPDAVEGAATMPYAVPYFRLTWHDAAVPLRSGWWRSVGHSFNAWFIEHAFDVATRAGGHHPLDLRLALLDGRPRHRAVLQALAPFLHSEAAPGRFRGVAVHESYGSVVAQAAEISLTAGGVRVHRVVCAVDCGLVLDPDGVRAQIGSGVIFGLTAALHGDITLQDGRVQQRDLDAYRLMTLEESPEIEVILLAGGPEPAGVGEIAVPPIAPAVCNAVLAGTGHPIMRLPIRLA